MKLKSAKYPNGQYANQTIHFPVIGDAQFDKDGNLEVELDEEKLEAFILLTKESFNFSTVEQVEKDIKKKEKEKKKKEKEQAELEKMLNEASGDELLELLKETGDKAFIERAINEAWNDNKLRAELKKKVAA